MRIVQKRNSRYISCLITTANPLYELEVVSPDIVVIQARKVPSIWVRFWLKFFFGLEWMQLNEDD